MIGLVHVANRIEERRALRVGEAVELRVRAAGLRDHERGRRFAVVAEAWAAGERVWEERSTYLRRSGSGSGGSGRRNGESEAPPAGGAAWTVPGDAGRRYAAVSGDRNPIHLHAATAKLFGRPAPIAHGVWLKARCLAALEGRVPEACAVEVRFKLPVRLVSRVAFTSHEEEDGARAFELRSARNGRPHLSGRVSAHEGQLPH